MNLELRRSVDVSPPTALDTSQKRQAVDPIRPTFRTAPRAPSRYAPWLYPALVALLTIFVIAPLAYPGFFQSHTGLLPVYDLIDLHSHPAASWTPTFGRGLDAFRNDGVLGYSLAELFHLVGLSFLDSIKLVYALAFVLSGLGMFWLSRRIWGSAAAGLLSAMLYVYLPYHVALVYVRGAFAEAGAWAIMPFALLAVTELCGMNSPRLRRYALTIGMVALLGLAQFGLAILFAILAVVWVLALRSSNSSLHRATLTLLGTVLAGLGLAMLLTLPTWLQNNFTVLGNRFTPAFAYPFQFLTATWGTALPSGNYLDPFPFQVGIAALGLTVLALALLARDETEDDGGQGRTRRVTFTAALLAGLLLLLMTPWAAPIWELTGAKFLVEYPFQLFAFIGLALSVVVGSIPLSDSRLNQMPMLAALSVIPILAVYAYLAPEYHDFAPTHPPLASFNQNELMLLDAKIVRPPGILRHGATVELDLRWQALRQVNHDYTVFVHVVDESGKTWGSQDSKPQDGALPTIKWAPGRVISDTHTVQIDLAGPPEGYHLELGLYTAATGERAVTDTGATEIRVEENR